MPDAAKLAEKAAAALNLGNYSAAIELYTQALQEIPESVDYYTKRSTAHQRNAEYGKALKDAEIAVVLGHQRGKREAIGTAQLRRGISLYLLERYGDAGFCFKIARKFNAGDKSGELWEKRLEVKMGTLEEWDVRGEVTIKEMPDVEVPKLAEEEKSNAQAEEQGGTLEETKPQPPTEKQKPAEKQRLVPMPTETKLKHQWYQTSKEVVISIFLNGAKPKKEDIAVEIQENSISLSFPLPQNNSTLNYNLDPLFHSINPSKSTWNLLTTRMELKLCKSINNQTWKSLERTGEVVSKHDQAKPETATDRSQQPQTSPASSATTSATTKTLAYPTSSKKGAKNWDKLAEELTARNMGEHEDDEMDSVNAFFKKMFKFADDDTRRAMVKSYVESNGTTLSMDWEEVKKGKVGTFPPEELAAKKWDE